MTTWDEVLSEEKINEMNKDGTWEFFTQLLWIMAVGDEINTEEITLCN